MVFVPVAKTAVAVKPVEKPVEVNVKPSESVEPVVKPVEKPAAAKKGAALTGAALAQAVILKKMKTKPDAGTTVSYACVPSGSTLINDVIGGSVAYDGKGLVCPGYPRRRLTEVFGAESSGKTTAALHAVAEVQKQGGWALYLDYEHTVDHAYARKIGVSYDPNKLLLYQPNTVEEGFDYMFIAIMSGADLIVVDSVAAMIPKKELEAKTDAEAQIGLQARAFSRQLPKLANIWLHHPDAKARNASGTAVVFINQTRATIQAGGGPADNTHTAGGKALKFYFSLRLQFTRIRSESVAKKDKFSGREVNVPFGNHTRVKVVKNKMDAKAGHTTDIFIRFGLGIDEFYSLIEAAAFNKIVKKEGGGWFSYKGDRFQGREKFRAFLKDNPKVFAEIRNEVLKIVQASATLTEEDLDEVDQMLQSSSRSSDDDSTDDDSDTAPPEELNLEEEASASSDD